MSNQRTTDWYEAHLGRFTAPEIWKLMGTPKSNSERLTETAKSFIYEKVAERLTGGTARAHNRGMVEFCSVDPRLLPTCYVPLADFSLAAAMAAEAVAMGAAALLVASGCPAGHSPSHRSLDPVWAVAQEADISVVFHVGGAGDLIDRSYFVNGLPIPPDFHGGAENFRSVDYMAIPLPPMQTLATMLFGRVGAVVSTPPFVGIDVSVLPTPMLLISSYCPSVASSTSPHSVLAVVLRQSMSSASGAPCGLGANAILMFQNDALVSKAQFGLG